MWVVRSRLTRVEENLALEERLFQSAPAVGGALFFCRNRPAVVWGKNQNPWNECRVDRLVHQGIALARRVSGGGTVYHDEGNLNYGLILPRARYDRDRCFAWVLAALRACGIPAERQGSTSLAVARRKCSGTAFAYRGNAVLHHGTLLIASDLARLHGALRAPDAVVEGHAIASDPADVMNLGEVRSSLTADAVEAALEAALPSFFPVDRLTPVGPEQVCDQEWKMLVRRNRSVAWCLGRTPPFHISRASLGSWSLGMHIRADKVVEARLKRPMGEDRILPVSGLRFRPNRLAQRIRSRCAETEYRQAADWLAAAWG